MLLEPGYDLTVNNSLTLNGGTLTVTGVAGVTPVIHLKGNVVRNAGAFNHGNGKILFEGASPQTIAGALNFYDVVKMFLNLKYCLVIPH